MQTLPEASVSPATVGAPSAAAVQEQADQKRKESIRLAKIDAANAQKFLDEAVYISEFSGKKCCYLPKDLFLHYLFMAMRDIDRIQDYRSTEAIEGSRKEIRNALEFLESLVAQKKQLQIRAGSKVTQGGILGRLIGTSWEKSDGWDALRTCVRTVEMYLDDRHFPTLGVEAGLSEFEKELDTLEKFVTAYLDHKDPKEATREILSTQTKPLPAAGPPANLEVIRKPLFDAVARAKVVLSANESFMRAHTKLYQTLSVKTLNIEDIEDYKEYLSSTPHGIEALALQIDRDVARLQEKINKIKVKTGAVSRSPSPK